MQPDFLTYRDYKALDFFYDDLFVQFVQSGAALEDSYWLGLQQTYPYLAQEMSVARDWMLLLKLQPVHKSPQQEDALWSQIVTQIPVYKKQKDRSLVIRKFSRIAAAIAAVWLLVMLVLDISQFGDKDYGTAYGQRKTLGLPDQSVVNLNSNSKLSYVRDWKSDKPRTVWLEGEALFDVKHTAVRNRVFEKDYFVVHVGDLKLTVLGTKFNVKERRGKIAVTLFEGSVQVEDGTGILRTMVPGETFVYDQEEKDGDIVENDVKNAIAWTANELSVEHANLSDIIEILEDNYGYRVELKDSNLLDQRLMGTIPTRNAQDILFVIRHTMDLHITQQNKVLTIDHLPNRTNRN